MCKGLQNLGHEVVIAHCKAPRDEQETVGKKVAEYGLKGNEDFALDRHIPLLKTLKDIWGLPSYIAREKFDIVHVHLCHDHAFGGILTKCIGRKRPILVRTLHRREVLKDTFGYRLQLKGLTDGWLTFTEKFRQKYIDRFGLDPDRLAVQPMPIDLARFSPDRTFRDMRSVFGIAADAPVIGIVGRYQKYRRAEIFLEAAAKVLKKAPNARFVVIGRSSQMQETIVKPMKQLGIEQAVILPGYRIDDYDDTLACLDIFSLLMPGFDGTARAVREAMALGKPCVVSDFGMLPDIVPHGKSGFVTAIDADKLADAWLQLIEDQELRARLGQGALMHARRHFGMDAVGPCLEGFYQVIMQSNQGYRQQHK